MRGTSASAKSGKTKCNDFEIIENRKYDMGPVIGDGSFIMHLHKSKENLDNIFPCL